MVGSGRTLLSLSISRAYSRSSSDPVSGTIGSAIGHCYRLVEEACSHHFHFRAILRAFLTGATRLEVHMPQTRIVTTTGHYQPYLTWPSGFTVPPGTQPRSKHMIDNGSAECDPGKHGYSAPQKLLLAVRQYHVDLGFPKVGHWSRYTPLYQNLPLHYVCH